MKNAFFISLFILLLPCVAGKKDFVPEKDMILSITQVTNPNWKAMGFCDSTSQLCIYIDTVFGYIIQLRRLNQTKFSVRDVDNPSAIDKLIEGAYLTSKFREKKLKLVNKSFFTLTYEDRRGKMIIEVSTENKRIKKITVKK